MMIIYVKAFVSFALSILAYLSVHSTFRTYLSTRKAFVFAYLLLRVFPFILVYVVLGFESGSDVPFFYEYAKETLSGKLVYRDFWQPYSPLFSYMNGAALLLWDNPKSIIILMLLGELAAILMTKKLIQTADWLYFVVYLLLPASFVNAVFGSQEDILLWFFFAAFTYFVSCKRYVAAAFASVLGLLVTKALFIFSLILLLFIGSRRLLVSFALIGGVVATVLFLIFGVQLLAPLEIGNLSFAPNLISVLYPFHNFPVESWGRLNWMLLLGCVATTLYVFSRFPQPTNDYRALRSYLTVGFVLFHILLIIIHKNSLPNYWYIIMLPITVSFAQSFSKKLLVLFLALNVMVAVQPSLWYHLGANWYPDFVHLSVLQVFEYALQCCYLIASSLLLVSVLRIYKKASHPATTNW